MIERALIVLNRLGLHARASARFVRLASEFECAVVLTVGDRKVNGKSLLDVLTLAASQGTNLNVITDGTDELQAADALERLVGDKFKEAS